MIIGKILFKNCKSAAVLLFMLGIPSMVFAETVGVFFNSAIPQITFAAGDVKTALESKGFTVEMLDLAKISTPYANKKVIIAVASDAAVATALTGQGGTAPANLGEQAYALRTTTQGTWAYWSLGGDINGAMYGGLQLAENIGMNGFANAYNGQEAPFLLKRGMKLNMPMDKRIPTYVGGWSSTSTKRAIPHVWDITFWKTLIDQQARYRYNLLSVWTHHPFPALVKLADYPKASLPRIEGWDGFVKEMNHEARVAFWQEVMQYAHDRGMSFYFFNWNVYLDFAKDQYSNLSADPNNSATKDYNYKSMQALLQTYPNLDGFGISAGDGMGNFGSSDQKTAWTWDSWGNAIRDYLVKNPSRNFNLIHRGIGTSFSIMNAKYKPLNDLPNATVNYSVKYAQAHMYSTPTPRWVGGMDEIEKSGEKTFVTVRNDDYFYINWGDPKFVRDFMAGIPNYKAIAGMYIGSDGYSPSRTYFYKDNTLNGQLEVNRRWYMEMLWGRLSYNPQTSDDVFKAMLTKRFPTVSAANLFEAWTLASRPLPKVTELIMRDWSLDFHWWPEACYSDPGRGTGFRTIDGFAQTGVAKGSDLCDISVTGSKPSDCGSKKTSYVTADEMQADADKALTLVNGISGGGADLNVTLSNIKHMAYLSNYYAYKVRGATYKKAGKTVEARAAMGSAYCYWMGYTRAMENTYKPDSMREVQLPSWQFADKEVLKEYTDLGGSGVPTNCNTLVAIGKKTAGLSAALQIQSLSTSGIIFTMPEAGAGKVSLFSSTGKKVIEDFSYAGKKGQNYAQFPNKIIPGVYIVQVKFGDKSAKKMSTILDL